MSLQYLLNALRPTSVKSAEDHPIVKPAVSHDPPACGMSRAPLRQPARNDQVLALPRTK